MQILIIIIAYFLTRDAAGYKRTRVKCLSFFIFFHLSNVFIWTKCWNISV